MDEKLELSSLLEQTKAVLVSASAANSAYAVAMTIFGTLLDLYLAESNAYFTLNSIVSLVAGYILLRMVMGAAGMEIGSASFASYFGLSIIVGIATLVGLIAAVIPGIIIAVRWLPAYAVLMKGDASATAAPGESWNMTDGQFWPLLAALATGVGPLLLAAVAIFLWQEGLAVASVFDPLWIASTAATNLLISTFTIFITALGVASYMLLKPSDLGAAEVFA